MSTETAYEMWFDASPDVSTDTAHGKRYRRAETEWMIVIPRVDDDHRATGEYDVYSASGSQYEVDITVVGSCDGPDASHNDPIACKHWLRVQLLIARTAMPDTGERVPEALVDMLVSLVDVFVHSDRMAESAVGRTGDSLRPVIQSVARLEAL